MFRLRRFIPLLLLAVVVATRAASAQPALEAGFVQLRVNGEPREDFFEVLLDADERPYLPFSPFMSAVEMPVTYRPELNSAVGYLADGTTRFTLNLNRRELELGETRLEVPRDTFVVRDQVLYVRFDELTRWLPLEAAWNVPAYEVRVRTDYRLPSESARRRRAQRETLLAERDAAERAQAAAEQQVPWFDPGMFQIGSRAQSGPEHDDEFALNLQGVHRFLKGDLEYSLTQQWVNEEQQEGRVDFARLQYYDARRTWQVTLGDTYLSFSPLVLDAFTFQGGSFYTGGEPQRFGRTGIIGTAPPGSEVDLYRRGVLLDFTTTDEQGFYRFANVPLAGNSTNFEARVYTPDGRSLVREHTVSSARDMLPPGELGTQGGTGYGREGASLGRFQGAQARYGVTRWLTLGSYVLELEDYQVTFEEEADFEVGAAFALLRPFSWLLLRGEGAQDREVPGQATRSGALFAFEPASLELQRRHYAGAFAPPERTRSEDFVDSALLQQEDLAVANTRVWETNLQLLGLLGDFGETRERTVYEARADRRLTRSVSAGVRVEEERFREQTAPVKGSNTEELTAGYRINPLTRAEATATWIHPLQGEDTEGLRAGLAKQGEPGSPWSYALRYQAYSNRENTGSAEVGYLFRKRLRASIRADSDGGWLLTLNLTAPLRVDGGGVEMLEPDQYGDAGLQGTVFVDRNNDGVYQPEQEPTVSGARVLAPGIQSVRSGEDGRYRAWGVPPGNVSAVQMDVLSTDALYAPAQERTYLVPRPGQLLNVDLALVPSSGLEGEVRHTGPGTVSPAHGVEMVLRSAAGDEVARAAVEFDGVFVFEQLSPGTYTLSADAAQLEARGVRLSPAQRTVTVPGTAEPQWLSGFGFDVEQR